MTSVGIIDTVGFVGAVNALDTCLKTADVEFVRFDKMSGGIVSIIITGDVAAVSASVAAGVEAANLAGKCRKHTIIARLDDQTQKMLCHSNSSGHEVVNNAAPTKITVMENQEEQCSVVEKLIGEDAITEDKSSTSVSNDKEYNYSEESLNLMTVSRLRKLARDINIKGISREKIKRSRKFDLIANILNELKEKEE
ncbi:BMC domain-containing protein [Acetobacterium carbinolicum]|uniref:BMC domain-containing protein n=1 Tax=Acetobacterium TaxID=33951 RepID=UPI002ACAAA12|nr:BMC domain-containing protein [Acetobacterium sp. K1/6]MDZ5725893.1 BMC domain-containing protein [Acetobacterium sp. K1/6]